MELFHPRPARSRRIDGARTASPASRDDRQQLCFALALWNGKDPILKERLFGLTNGEGNHGEDVKEYYYYLDSHADAFLHEVPLQVSAGGVPVRATWSRPTAAAGRGELEYELLDTGVFDDEPLLRCVRRVREGGARGHPHPDHACQSRPGGRDAARAADAVVPQHLVVGHGRGPAGRLQPSADVRRGHRDRGVARRPRRARSSPATATPTLLFTENETNTQRLFGDARVARRTSRTASTTTSCMASATAVNPERDGHEGRGALSRSTIGPGESRVVRLRLLRRARRPLGEPGATRPRRGFRRGLRAPPARGRRVLRQRSIPASLDAEPGCVMRQALAGMLWTKQYYHYDVDQVARRSTAREPFQPSDAQRRRATTTGITWSTPTSSRCRTSGSTPGTPRGTSRST